MLFNFISVLYSLYGYPTWQIALHRQLSRSFAHHFFVVVSKKLSLVLGWDAMLILLGRVFVSFCVFVCRCCTQLWHTRKSKFRTTNVMMVIARCYISSALTNQKFITLNTVLLFNCFCSWYELIQIVISNMVLLINWDDVDLILCLGWCACLLTQFCHLNFF